MMRRIGILIMLTTFVACGEEAVGPSVSEYEEQARRVAELAAKKNPARPPTAAVKDEPASASIGASVPEYRYVSLGKRDPFRSYVLEQAGTRKRDRGPLEQYELDQLSLVAVIWDTKRSRAVVEDPSGQAYVVSQSTPIGKHDGRVVKIHDRHIVVQEKYVDYRGDVTEKDVEMWLAANRGG